MKKTLVAIAALAAVSSFAQSTVTLYGVADASFGSYKAGITSASPQAQLRVNDGGNAGLSGSRLGFRVNEDLGGGMSAFSTLEMGLNVDTGSAAQNGLAFGRQAFVGLGGGFGRLAMGRQYTAYDDLRGSTDAFGHSSFSPSLFGWGNNMTPTVTGSANAAGTFVGDGGLFNGRVDNQIKYNTPNFGGVSAALTYGFGENKTATVSAGKVLAGHVLYANGPLTVGFAHQVEKAAGNIAAQKYTLLAGGYDFGSFKLNAGINRDTGAAKASEFQLSGTVPVGALALTVGVARSKGTNDKADTTFGLQGAYSLSKRTTAYLGLRNAKGSDGGAAVDHKINHVAAGVRHTF